MLFHEDDCSMKYLKEKYLIPVFEKTALEIWHKDFDRCFQIACDEMKPTDNAFNNAFNKVCDIAAGEMNRIISEWERSLHICGSMDEPIRRCIHDLASLFLESLRVDDYMDCILGDYYHDKKKEMIKKGLIDEEGDPLLF